MKLLIFVGLNIGGYLGWSAAEPWGLGWAFALSSVGSLLGVYAGWWAARQLGKKRKPHAKVAKVAKFAKEKQKPLTTFLPHLCVLRGLCARHLPS